MFQIIKSSVFLYIGLSLLFFAQILDAISIVLIGLGTIFSIIAIISIRETLEERFIIISKQVNYGLHNFAWYKENYPESVNNNTIHCRLCNSRAIESKLITSTNDKQLFSKSVPAAYHRISCKQCKNTLFYSPHDKV